ncbi:hypothetical protein PPSIR1_06066 [Plesiocystis pacifica SIR-1]|uniref:Uncharacterized protein n=1 Tax=Plesiocystis pacifica SIR-1 TaxID=391625 RepID=A6G6T8_9BACT|nr:hypothetical protein [Plesiocystis pacifica]EDM78391.1 hypothetical protein PPSIR1_06066 [Plesiocystis pacifica SIR-1]
MRPLDVFEAPVPDDVSAQERFVEADTPLRVVWRSRLDGRLEVAQEQVRIQRLVGLGVAQADVVALVRDAWPNLVARLPQASKLEGWVQVATRWVSSQLRANGLEPSQFLMGERGADLVAARFVLHAAHNGEAPGNLGKAEFLELAKAAWSQAWHDLVVGGKGLDVVEMARGGTPKRPTTAGLSLDL